MLNFFIFFYKKNSSFSFVFCYSKRSCTFYDRFSLKIHYSMLLKYLQMINCFLFILIRSTEFYKFNDTFNSFDFKFASCDIIC